MFSNLHIGVKLLFEVTGAEFLTLESADTGGTFVRLADIARTHAELFEESRILDLFFPPLEEPVITLIAAFVGMDSHSRRREYEAICFRAREKITQLR